MVMRLAYQFAAASNDGKDDTDYTDDLDVDEDVLAVAKELAARREATAGRVLSDLARMALTLRTRSARKPYAVPILPPRRRTDFTPEVVIIG
jgi:hypothetical protein